MINAEAIGKNIRRLRKERNISQEKMAEDLGMYQADISNLERAVGGSGIADLFKLDLIADYFGVPLVSIISGTAPAKEELLQDVDESETDRMQALVIRDAQVYRSEDDMWRGSELTLASPDGEILYFSFTDNYDEPKFFKSAGSLLPHIAACRNDEKAESKLKKHCFLSGNDYVDIYLRMKPEMLPICRYLLCAATEDPESVRQLIDETRGKAFSEITVPLPILEPDQLFDVDYTDLSAVYRFRLMVETSLKYPHAYDDIFNVQREEKAILKKLKEACGSEEAYKVWKKDLIDAKVKEVMEKQHIVACSYMFIGIGQYEEVMPIEMVDSFKCWIDQNGSAFFGGMQDANKKQIRTFVSKHIADELLGIESPMV